MLTKSRKRNFLEIQTLQISNEKLTESIYTTESDKNKLTVKIQCITFGYETLQNSTEKLTEKIHTAKKWQSKPVLKDSYDKLSDRMSLLEGSLYAIKIISKDEKI